MQHIRLVGISFPEAKLTACDRRMQNFDRFSDAMLTLFQCFTLDSAGEVYRPLITHNPVLTHGCRKSDWAPLGIEVQ